MLPGSLKWLSRLKEVKGQCYVVVSPDPRGQGFPGRKGLYYGLRFGTGPGIEKDNYEEFNPSYIYAYKYCTEYRTTSSTPSPRLDPLRRSNYSFVIDTGLKNAYGQGVGDVLFDIVKKFPKHDFESKEGIRLAVQEIAEHLNDEVTAGIEENRGQYQTITGVPQKYQVRRR